ncbi:hypothetical protein J5X84_25260 [Streptosporangiaceae bacterium NEAU-GS5]|nr:hypothetical protein [Streptosporangiaceae bacterium NEAU-GS5]
MTFGMPVVARAATEAVEAVARAAALAKYSPHRFPNDWDRLLAEVVA